MTNVAFLLDRSNNWFSDKLHALKEINTLHKFNCETYFEYKNISNFEIVFVIGYTKMLPKEFLEGNKLVLIIHESDLPKGKGFSPVQWQILEGKNKIPITMFIPNQNVDDGDIVLKNYLKFEGTELFDEIREKQAQGTIDLIVKFLKTYPNYKKIKQIGTSTIYRKRTDKDNQLDPNKSLKDQFNLLRIGNNKKWPSYFFIKGKKYLLKIYNADKS